MVTLVAREAAGAASRAVSPADGAPRRWWEMAWTGCLGSYVFAAATVEEAVAQADYCHSRTGLQHAVREVQAPPQPVSPGWPSPTARKGGAA